MKSRFLGVVGLMAVVGIAAVAAQTPAGPAFDVVSIKPSDPNALGTTYRVEPGGRFSGTGFTAEFLIELGFRGPDGLLHPEQIVGAPDWVRSDRFGITAAINGPDRPDQATFSRELPTLLRALLADRFKLVAHSEPRSLPVYALVLARGDGRLGPQLKAAPDCTDVTTPSPDSSRHCGAVVPRPNAFSATGVPLSVLVSRLTTASGRLVIDHTGLNGRFDVNLQWSPNPTTDTADDSPSIFTAVQEQLGLKLQSTTDLVNSVIIDRIERPTPD